MPSRPQPSSWTDGALIARRYRLAEEAPGRGIVPVWRAVDTQRRSRDVALSRLPQTAAILASAGAPAPKAEHPDVLLPLEVGRHDDAGYLVTEWRDGEALERWLDRFEHRRPPTRLAWRCFARLCAQMETVHRARAGDRVHGWLSPRSLLVTDPAPDTADQLAVMDLGLAGLGVLPAWRRDDGVEWTAWLAPEQAGGAFAASQSADVFALAVVMTELLTGHPLAVAHERRAWWQLAQEGDHAVRARLHELRPELMGAPVDLLAQALCRDPVRRFPDAGVFRKALRQAGVKMAVERAGTAMIRAPHRVEDERPPPREAPPSEQVARSAAASPGYAPTSSASWAPDETVTVAEEVSPYADEFREAFVQEEFPATEPVVVRGPSVGSGDTLPIEPATLPLRPGADLFAADEFVSQGTAPYAPTDEAHAAGAEAFTTPMVRWGPGAAPPSITGTGFQRTEPLLPAVTPRGGGSAPGGSPRPPAAPSPPVERVPQWMVIAVATFLAFAVAVFVYVMAR